MLQLRRAECANHVCVRVPVIPRTSPLPLPNALRLPALRALGSGAEDARCGVGWEGGVAGGGRACAACPLHSVRQHTPHSQPRFLNPKPSTLNPEAHCAALRKQGAWALRTGEGAAGAEEGSTQLLLQDRRGLLSVCGALCARRHYIYSGSAATSCGPGSRPRPSAREWSKPRGAEAGKE
eukprot:2107065-Rhodomonas_salina.2